MNIKAETELRMKQLRVCARMCRAISDFSPHSWLTSSWLFSGEIKKKYFRSHTESSIQISRSCISSSSWKSCLWKTQRRNPLQMMLSSCNFRLHVSRWLTPQRVNIFLSLFLSSSLSFSLSCPPRLDNLNDSSKFPSSFCSEHSGFSVRGTKQHQVDCGQSVK